MKNFTLGAAVFAACLIMPWAASAQLIPNNLIIEELAGQRQITGTADYDQVDYPGSSGEYVPDRNADGSVSITKPGGDIDQLIDIDGLWFIGEEQWYPVNGWASTQADGQTITGRSDAYDQVDYTGARTEYMFLRNADASISVTKPNGAIDRLINIDGIWFTGEEIWYSIGELTALTHEPEPIQAPPMYMTKSIILAAQKIIILRFLEIRF